MKAKRILMTIVGLTQGAIGILALILTCILAYSRLYNNGFLNIQIMLNVPTELLPLFLLILSIFGFFSLINGLFLLHER